MRVLLVLGYYEGGGFTTVMNMLSKHLQYLNINVTIAARVVRINPPDHVRLIKLNPNELPKVAEEYDVVHIHQSYPYMRVAANLRPTNIIFTSHGFPPILIVPGISNKLIHLFLNYVGYKQIFRKYKPVTTAISMYVQNQLKKMYGLNSVLIPNGVDLTLFKPIKDDEKPGYPTIINVTSYNRFKGSDILLKSFIAIKRKYPKARLIARGLSKTEKIPHTIKDSIIDLDFLPYEELAKWYTKADIYLLTSRWESFGLPILEAFASGTPVIALDRNDARQEHILNSGAGFLFKNERELLAAVDSILKNFNEYSKKAIEYAKHFDWNIIVKRYIDIYEQVFSKQKH